MKGKTLTHAESDRLLPVEEWKMFQLRPAARFERQDCLIDGKTPLPEGKPVECGFLDLVETYDIVAPDAVVRAALEHPGTEQNFAADGLDAVVRNEIVYRFLPRGACTIRHRAKALRTFKLGYMGFIQSNRLYETPGEEDKKQNWYYIPKTLPFEKAGEAYDFQNIQSYPRRLPCALNFNEREKNLSDPENLPERFLQLIGTKDGERPRFRVGYALGYSLVEGMTRPEIRAKNCENATRLYTSSKSYPHAVDRKMGMISKGTEFDVLAYRQYFNPAAYKNATSVYWHPQGRRILFYADYHRPVKEDVIPLPKELQGKGITVIEKTPSLTIHSKERGPFEGLCLSVDDNYGYVVLALE